MPLLKKVAFLLLILSPTILIPSASAQTGDTTPPTTSHVLNPTDPDGEWDWYVSPVNVTLSADDLDSGVASIHWKIGNDPWQEKTFPPTLNLLQNSSFELGGGSIINGWKGEGAAGTVFTQDNAEFYEDLHSAKIEATTSGDWGGWSNRDTYAVAQPWDNMSTSAWIKTENVVGDAYFKVYARTSSSGDVCVANCTTPGEAITGTTNWTRLFKNFTVTVSDAYGVYLDIGLEGTGTVWIDYATLKEVPTDTSVDFVISKNGSFDLEYYSVDHSGNEELLHHIIPLKIDTKAPGNWRDFEITRGFWCSSDHTLFSQIRVSDETSGLQPFSDDFQYSVNAGDNWGYFDETKCLGTVRECPCSTDHLDTCSEWLEGGWLPLLTLPSDWQWWWPPYNDTLLITGITDYCNSNWNDCKIVRFRVRDVAGNESNKDICINGAWSQTSGQGDVYAATGINFAASGAGDNTDGLVISGGDIAGFVSSQGWVVANYSPILIKPSYAGWQEKFPSLTPIDQLPTEDGFYLINSNFTIANTTIPSGLSTAIFEAVVFVNGDLRINRDFSLGNQGALVFIVNGDVDVDKNVENMAGMFFAEGKFDSAYNGGNNLNTLNVYGSVLATSFEFNRSLKGQQNSNNPAELFLYEPKYLELMVDLLSEKQRTIRWFEVGL